MKRHLCITVLFALVLVPDWAAACWPRWGSPADERAYYVPIYHGPVYCAPQPVYGLPVYVQPCSPLVPPALLPPRVEPSKLKGGSSSTAPTRPITRPAPTKPPEIEAIRPAGGVGAPPAKPESAPAPLADSPNRGGLFDIPKDPKPPVVERPKNTDSIPPTTLPMVSDTERKLPPLDLPKPADPKLPPLTLPPSPGMELKLPPLDLPKVADPKLPPLDLPGAAVPVPAPSPDLLVPSPGLLTPKNPDALPPLTLPPDTPVAPVPPKSVEVRSSPLAAGRELMVSLLPASGAALANGARKVGFYNYTARDLALTIEGRSVTLPAMSYIHAQLPATFTWKYADRPTAQAAVPADASGLDVLIRE